MTEPWHVSAETLRAYLADLVDQPTASSVEAHLVGCERCRSELAVQSDATLMADSWASIERTIDCELGSRAERAATRAGLSDRAVRTLAPTLSLQLAWMAATLLALLAAAFISRWAGGPEDGPARMVFLIVAPLAPLAAVVAAISSASEPAPAIARAAPASRLRIGAVRATTVMVASVGVGLIASTVVPGGWIDAVVWLLPAAALSALGALGAGRVAPAVAVGWLGAAWVVTVGVAARLSHDHLAAFRPGAQVLYLAVSLIAVAAIVLRPDSLDLRSRP